MRAIYATTRVLLLACVAMQSGCALVLQSRMIPHANYKIVLSDGMTEELALDLTGAQLVRLARNGVRSCSVQCVIEKFDPYVPRDKASDVHLILDCPRLLFIDTQRPACVARARVKGIHPRVCARHRPDGSRTSNGYVVAPEEGEVSFCHPLVPPMTPPVDNNAVVGSVTSVSPR